MIDFLSIDDETQSAVDLTVCGTDVYAKHSSTNVLCMAYAFNDEPIQVWKQGEPIPARVKTHIQKGGTVVAHNGGGFEWVIWEHVKKKKYGWPPLSIEQLDDTMATANAMGFPGALDGAAKACGLEIGKDQKGRRVMLMLSQPKADGTFYTKEQVPEKFEELYEYCKTDVEVQRQLYKRLAPLNKKERSIWLLDHKINQRGIGIDLPLVRACNQMVKAEQERMQIELQVLTGNQVPSYNSHAAFKRWVILEGLTDIDSIDKESVANILAREDLPSNIRRALEIRKDAAKSSTAKLTAMLKGTTGGRARGCFEYYGAKQTGRWAGRRLQLQNMPRSKMKFKDIEDAITRFNNRDEIEMFYGNPMQVASDCLRSFLIPARGNKFLTADFSNIEGRCLAWLAGEEWKIKAFDTYDKDERSPEQKREIELYVLSVCRALGLKPKDIDETLRQIGKVIELSMGYAGGVGAFQNMAKAYGVKVTDEKANELKELWREANPKIVQYWKDVEHAARSAISKKGTAFSVGKESATITFRVRGSFLCATLPSGRTMYYPYPALWRQIWVKFKGSPTSKSFSGATEAQAKLNAQIFADKNKLTISEIGSSTECIAYKSYDTVTKQWGYTVTFGGSLVENLCQAISRDVLCEAMIRLESKGYPIVLHVHDEIVAEVKDSSGITLEYFKKVMSTVPEWARGFPIASSGWTGYRYRK